MVTARAQGRVQAKLGPLLDALDPSARLAVRLDGLETLARANIAIARPRQAAPNQLARLRALLDLLRAAPGQRDRLRATLASVVRETTAVALFSEAGIPNDRGLVSETVDRIARRLLPIAPDDGNLERLVSRVFRSSRDCAWIAAAPIELFVELADALGDVWGPVREAMADSIALLATRISALGLSVDLRDRSDPMYVRDSPFFRIPHVPLEHLPMVMAECRAQLGRVHERLETAGVSVDVVYRIDAIRRMMLRIERVLPLLSPATSAHDRAAAVRTLLGALTAGRIADESLRQLGRQNLGLLATKVIERVGHTGEHYVTSSRREYWKMLGSAAGGGAMVGLTVVGKFLARWAAFPPFVDGLLATADYAGTFILMQLLGFTLATKQPSMTAATLAATIKQSSRDPTRLDELVALIARISRSQLAAAVGNVFTVIPVAIAIDLAWVSVTGHHFFDEHAARHALESVDPRASSTIVFGALTGVLLWMSSLGAGWLENWVTYRRLPDAIRFHRLGRIVGPERMGRVADFVTDHSAGIGGNVTLGFLFGMLPALGKFFGLPLDSRHITISTGMLAFAGCSLGLHSITIWSCLGIVLIGLLNFGVSFALALAVAFRAREVTSRERVGLALSVLRSFVRRPHRFFLPPPPGRAITAPVVVPVPVSDPPGDASGSRD